MRTLQLKLISSVSRSNPANTAGLQSIDVRQGILRTETTAGYNDGQGIQPGERHLQLYIGEMLGGESEIAGSCDGGWGTLLSGRNWSLPGGGRSIQLVTHRVLLHSPVLSLTLATASNRRVQPPQALYRRGSARGGSGRR